jgi:inhibitor of cysteine peptidase
MKKMLKIIAMLLVIATVVFAAGCSGKETAKENTSVSNVSESENTVAANMTAGNVSDNLTENTTENVTLVAVDSNLTENVTEENETADNATNATE